MCDKNLALFFLIIIFLLFFIYFLLIFIIFLIIFFSSVQNLWTLSPIVNSNSTHQQPDADFKFRLFPWHLI